MEEEITRREKMMNQLKKKDNQAIELVNKQLDAFYNKILQTSI